MLRVNLLAGPVAKDGVLLLLRFRSINSWLSVYKIEAKGRGRHRLPGESDIWQAVCLSQGALPNRDAGWISSCLPYTVQIGS